MALIVVKRDGGKTPFDKQRIELAVLKAADAVGVRDSSFCRKVASSVEELLAMRSEVDITEIQKHVEDQLMSSKYKTLARAYIEYRHERDRLREKKGALSQEIKGLIDQSNADLLNE
ncbi:MAG: anaerobic ribonucleoside-triphosphate reductase, partial [Succinivibrionaceae bacterium]|nr:anaerobic ribonucleoside-triphosphate reductase [Succinivibrionaceae bacterium]